MPCRDYLVQFSALVDNGGPETETGNGNRKQKWKRKLYNLNYMETETKNAKIEQD